MTDQEFRKEAKRLWTWAKRGEEWAVIKFSELMRKRRKKDRRIIRACLDCGAPAKGLRCRMHDNLFRNRKGLIQKS